MRRSQGFPRIPGERDSGQNTLEHMGLAVLVAVVVVLALASAPALRDLAGNFTQAVCRVVSAVGGGGGCAGSLPPEARPHEYYRPDACLVSSSANTYGATGAIAVVTVGKEVSFLVERMSDGTVKVTAVQAGSAGLEAGIGAGINAGKVFRFGAEANVGGDVTLSYGDTWVFESQDEADNFIGDIKEQAAIDAAKDTGLLGLGAHAYDAVAGPDLPSPTITREEVSGELGADASAGLGLGRANRNSSGGEGEGSWNAGPNVNAGVELTGNGSIVIEHDHSNHTVAKIYELGGGGEAGAQVPTKFGGVEGERAGAMKVIRKEDGTLVGVQFVQSSAVNGEATVTTTNLPITNPEQRRIAEGWLASHNDGATTLRLTWDDMAQTTEPGPDADEFAHLLYDEARVTRAEYDSSVDPAEFGAEAKLGLQLGLNVYHESAEQDLNSAQYLGAPRGGNRRYLTYAECR
ncbi:MAG: hypothetical protein GEV03_01405 [Streptosporangiales bacterium]|nr:hypothetical protein [Streptosporangiales bacterium]